MHRFVRRIKYSAEEFVDKDKPLKNILTDFVDHYFLTYNHNQLRLMQLIYHVLTPKLKKRGLYLVFKGGNVMRMINQNVKEYLPPDADKVIMDIFEPFLKQSDNDFTIFVNPHMKNYNDMIRIITYEVFLALDVIKKTLLDHLPEYFDIFTLNSDQVHEAFKQLSAELKVKYVKLAPTLDLEILFERPNYSKSAVLVYENQYSVKDFLYNTANFALQFYDNHKNLIKFYLCRTKVNFQLNHSKELSGELIDISLPHKRDWQMATIPNTAAFNKFIAQNVIKQHNDEYDFDYYVINVHYIVHDLFTILFIQNKYPWDDSKYVKRLARLLYFIFVNAMNGGKPFGIHTIDTIIADFRHFVKQLQTNKPMAANRNQYLQDFVTKTDALSNPTQSQYKEYITTTIKYANAIMNICNKILAFQKGTQPINSKVLYDLNVV